MNEPVTYVRRNDNSHCWEMLTSAGWQPTGLADTADFLSVRIRLNDQGKMSIWWLRDKEAKLTL